MTFVILYLLVGCFLAHGRIYDIAHESSYAIEKDVLRILAVVLKWVVTWPAWVGR